MSASMQRKIAKVLRIGKVSPLMEWIYFHHFWFNLLVHCCLFAASYLLSFIILDSLFPSGEAYNVFVKTIAVLVIIRAVVFGYHDLYEGLWDQVSFTDLLNIIRAGVISTLIFASVGVFWEFVRVPQKVLFLDMVFCIVAIFGVRLIVTVSRSRISKSMTTAHQQILLAGPIKKVQTVTAEIFSDPLAFYNPVGIIDTAGAKIQRRLRINDLPVYTVEEAIAQRPRFRDVQQIVIFYPPLDPEELERIVAKIQLLKIPFTILPHFDDTLRARSNDFQPDSTESNETAPLPQRSAQKRFFLSPPHMGGLEQEYVRRAFQSNYIAPLGPMVDSFEQAFSAMIGGCHTLALSSGTAAIHLALKVIGVERGDTVITSTLTFIGGVTPIVYQGAMPIFIDCKRDTWNMDPELLANALKECEAVGKFPKAVVPTDLYGQCADYYAIKRICDAYGIPVVVDSAEAVGATYQGRHAGTVTTAGIYSFNGNKIITTSGGGMLVSSEKEFIEQARFLAQQARDPFPHYEHSRIGFNYRMSNILAGIGLAQLRVLQERVTRRRAIFEYYRDALGNVPGIEFMPEAPYGRCNRWLTVILIDPEQFGADRETVRLALEAENIESRPVWKPMHLQPVFVKANSEISPKLTGVGSKERPFIGESATTVDQSILGSGLTGGPVACRVVGGAVAEDLFNCGLCLPSGTAMNERDLDRVIDILLRCRRAADHRVSSQPMKETHDLEIS